MVSGKHLSTTSLNFSTKIAWEDTEKSEKLHTSKSNGQELVASKWMGKTSIKQSRWEWTEKKTNPILSSI